MPNQDAKSDPRGSPDTGPEISARGAPSRDELSASGIYHWRTISGANKQGLIGIVILIICLVIFAVTGLFIFLPFLTPLLLALIFTTVSYPLYDRVRDLIGRERKNLASGLTIVLLILMIFVPLIWLTSTLSREMQGASRAIETIVSKTLSKESIAALRSKHYAEFWTEFRSAFRQLKGAAPADRAPSANPTGAPDETPDTILEKVAPSEKDTSTVKAASPEKGASPPPIAVEPKNGESANRNFENGELSRGTDQAEVAEVQKLDGASGASNASGDLPFRELNDVLRIAGQATRFVGSLFVGFLGFVVQFFLLIFIMFYFFRDGPKLLYSLKNALPVEESYKTKVIDTFQGVSKSLIRGTLATALCQGAIASVGFLLVGIPAALFWGTMVAVTSLVPVVGTALVTVPLTLSFLVDQDWVRGIIVGVIALAISASDNLLRPLFLQDGLRLHPLWILLSILGGVSCFGALGIVVGPMVVVFLGTFLTLVGEESRTAARKNAEAAE